MGAGSSDGYSWDAHGSWTKPEPVACNAFHPYTSNPLLCKCGRPVQEHVAFMQRYNERMEAERIRQEEIKESVMEVLGIELIPDPGDEVIEISPGWKMKRREYEALRKVVLAQEEERKKPPEPKTCTHKHPDGSWAIEGGMFCNTCKLCGWSDL